MNTQPIHAAILAAGLSSRFGGQQKALHRLGDRTLLERSLEALLGAGVASATVVVGHRRGDVEEALKECGLDAEVHLLLNDRYADWNNFYSVELVCERLPPGELMVVNGDVIYSVAALRRVLDAAGADLYLAASAGEVDEEAMKVATEAGRVLGLGKEMALSSATGEFIGISRLTPLARERYSSIARQVRLHGQTNRYYEDVYDRLCGELVAVGCAVAHADWAEIDEPADLTRAQSVVERVDSASVPCSSADAPPL